MSKTGSLVASRKPTIEPLLLASFSANSSWAALRDCLLYPVGPVGCWPRDCKTKKSSTCNEGGRDVLGGLDRNMSDLCPPGPRLNTLRPPLMANVPPALKLEMMFLLANALDSNRDFLAAFFF